jgi:hypothetical protein
MVGKPHLTGLWKGCPSLATKWEVHASQKALTS